jgi:hypothetical protein
MFSEEELRTFNRSHNISMMSEYEINDFYENHEKAEIIPLYFSDSEISF